MSAFQTVSRITAQSRVARWWAVGITFTLLNIPILYVLVDIIAVPLAVATVLAGEAAVLARFLVNDRWVFKEQRPTWRRLWQYHAAVVGGFAIWWSATNFLSGRGVHYLAASLLGTGFSAVWSMFTNFLWVWQHHRRERTVVVAPES